MPIRISYIFKPYNSENIHSKETQSLSQSLLYTRMALINVCLLYCPRDDAHVPAFLKWLK